MSEEQPSATGSREQSSISQGSRESAPRSSQALPLHWLTAPTRRLPNFCNLGITLRLIVVVNTLLLVAALARADSLQNVLRELADLSIIAQPAMIASLLLCCALSRYANSKLTYWQGVSAIFAVECALALVFWFLANNLLPNLGINLGGSLPKMVLLFCGTTAIVLFYLDLRARSLSPALVEARLQALQARIRPHFLFNSINAVLSLIRAEPRRAERMLEDMAELFRVLMADNRALRPLDDELTLCRQYLEIEHIRLGDRLQVVWHTDGIPLHALVPPLFLQPLVENAVYHGIEPNDGAGEIRIDITSDGKRMTIRLSNPFHVGSTHVNGNRMAIANITERLQLHFDAEASLRADVREQRYIVTIQMPIQTQQS